MNVQKQIAKALLDIKAVFLRPDDPFTWVSGIRSPIYCDNRLILSYPEARSVVEAALADTVRREFPDCELLAGTSTAGIPHAAYVSELLGLPMCYVRGASKDHGRENRIEGRAEKGQKIVVVEDLISTGGSVVSVVEVLREAGCEVLGIASIFTYEMSRGVERFAEAGIKNVSLTNYTALLETAVEESYIKESDVPKLTAFQKNPQDAGWMSL